MGHTSISWTNPVARGMSYSDQPKPHRRKEGTQPRTTWSPPGGTWRKGGGNVRWLTTQCGPFSPPHHVITEGAVTQRGDSPICIRFPCIQTVDQSILWNGSIDIMIWTWYNSTPTCRGYLQGREKAHCLSWRWLWTHPPGPCDPNKWEKPGVRLSGRIFLGLIKGVSFKILWKLLPQPPELLS